MALPSVRKTISSPHRSRNQIRRIIKFAARGKPESFKLVADTYLNEVCEFLAISGYQHPDVTRRYAREVFHNLWLRIAYMRRVSDFERQLFILLQQIPVKLGPFQDVLVEKLVQLNATQRFLMVARDLEDWSNKNLSLATRIPRFELSKPLYDAWIKLVYPQKPEFDIATQDCLKKVVDCLEGFLDPSYQRGLCQKVKNNPAVSAFKAACLNLRCSLVELRQNARWEDDYRTAFLTELAEDLALIKPLKPGWSEKLRNQFSFTCISQEVTS